MIYYPIFLDLRGKPVLVVGAGKVALRKTRGLLEAGALVTVVAPRWEPAFDELPVTLLRRAFEPGDIDGASLVFTATDDREVNRTVAILAKARAIPVNVADAPPECDFLVPSRVRRGNLQVAISTGGEDPRRAVAIRRRIEQALEAE